MCKRNEHETFLITMMKSDVCIKLKHIQISLDIYQDLYLIMQNQKKKEINISPMEAHQKPNKCHFQTRTCKMIK